MDGKLCAWLVEKADLSQCSVSGLLLAGRIPKICTSTVALQTGMIRDQVQSQQQRSGAFANRTQGARQGYVCHKYVMVE